MALRSLVERNVALAFTLLDDLKESVTLRTSTTKSYNFASGDIAETVNSKVVQGIVERNAARGSLTQAAGTASINGEYVKLIINKADIPNIEYNQYDEFVVSGKVYQILGFQDNSYTLECEAVGG
jgi:hypothetical protein